MTRHHSCRVTPFGHPRIHARLTAPRGISQPPTSFIGSRCQGIHHAPFNTYKHKNQSFHQKLHKQTHHPHQGAAHSFDARNHYPITKHHTPPPRWSDTTPKRSECCLRTQQCAWRFCCLENKTIRCRAPSRHPLRANGSSRLTPPPIEGVFRGAP